MTVGAPSKLPDILANNELKERLVKMAKEGASLCELYVEMGISKATGKAWRDRDGDYYSKPFSALIDELTTLSQCWWERMGRDCLGWDKFQATVYNRQMQGRFKDDWSPHQTTDITSKGQSISLSAEDMKIIEQYNDKIKGA